MVYATHLFHEQQKFIEKGERYARPAHAHAPITERSHNVLEETGFAACGRTIPTVNKRLQMQDVHHTRHSASGHCSDLGGRLGGDEARGGESDRYNERGADKQCTPLQPHCRSKVTRAPQEFCLSLGRVQDIGKKGKLQASEQFQC